MDILNFEDEIKKQEKAEKDKRELEERLKGAYGREKPRIVYLHPYLHTRSGEYEGVLEDEKPLSLLPHGEGWQVLGLYEWLRHSMTVGGDIKWGTKGHTRRHEKVHSRQKHYDETQTDNAAESPYYWAHVA